MPALLLYTVHMFKTLLESSRGKRACVCASERVYVKDRIVIGETMEKKPAVSQKNPRG